MNMEDVDTVEQAIRDRMEDTDNPRKWAEYVCECLNTRAPDATEALLEAIAEIAKQKKTEELETEYDVECADFEGGYDACVDRARAALAKIDATLKGDTE